MIRNYAVGMVPTLVDPGYCRNTIESPELCSEDLLHCV